MKLTSVPLRSLIVLLIGLLLCGCGSAPADVAPTQASAAPTATTPPPMSTAEAPTVTPVPEEDDAAWDYVALGDSIPGGVGVDLGKSYVHLYAAYIAEDLGVDVTVNNRSAASETTVSLLGKLQSDETMRALVSEAEVITVWVGSNDIWRLLYGPGGAGNAKCGPIGDLDMDCFETEVQALVDRIDAILTEIRSLRAADQALVRIVDECNWFVEYWRDADAFEQLKEPAFEVWSRAISDLGAKHGVAVVHTYVVCNGPDGDDPIAADYLQPTDPWHFNEAGHKMIADLHRAVGYDRGP
jgi:lysophospholipase L1-like esterase